MNPSRDLLLSLKELADAIGKKESTLADWRSLERSQVSA
jgi:hypothetical protein